MTVKFADYLGQTVNARYAVERYIDGADVPVIREGEITIGVDAHGDIMIDDDGNFIYPFETTFELI
jgi:hypothetical protein